MPTNKSTPAGELGEEFIQNVVQMRRVPDLNTFRIDVINGLAPNLKRGALGLVPVMRRSANPSATVKKDESKL